MAKAEKVVPFFLQAHSQIFPYYHNEKQCVYFLRAFIMPLCKRLLMTLGIMKHLALSILKGVLSKLKVMKGIFKNAV